MMDEIIVTGSNRGKGANAPFFENLQNQFADIRDILKEESTILQKIQLFMGQLMRLIPDIFRDLGNIFLKGLAKTSPSAASGVGDFFGGIMDFIPFFGSGGIHSMGRRGG